MTTAISLRNVVKTFGPTRALDGLDLEVATGEVHAYLGPNGAGKSVTIRILLDLLRPDSGETQLLGGDPWNDAVELHHRLAHVPGDVSLWPNLSGGEIIDYFVRLSGDGDTTERDEFVERLELDPRKKAGTYSKGNRQKVALVIALSSRAELLIFDEPTSGLDPLMETVFQDAVVEMAKDGRMVFLSSHILTRPSTTAPSSTSGKKIGPSQSLSQTSPLAGFTTLLRFMMRRDRVRAPAWFAGVVGLITASGASVTGLYSSPEQLANYAEITGSNAVLKALNGPGYGLDNPTQGAVVMNEIGMYTLVGVALMCVFMVIRHTRAEEETDRAELVRAAPVGRYANLAAASL